MGHMTPKREEELLVAERAADWLRRLETGDTAERAAFVSWLKESPRHVRELLLMGAWDKVMGEMLPGMDVSEQTSTLSRPQNVLPLSASRPISVRAGTKSKLRHRTGLALAASLAAVAVIGAWLTLTLFPLDTYTTATGEQRAIELDDGSVVQLNARSRIKVSYSSAGRDIALLDGQALFKVAADPVRPFRVHAGQTTIQALGTEFDVYKQTARTRVAVLEGSVRVAAHTLRAGDAIDIAAAGRVTPVKALTVAEATAWRQRRLVFRKDTLADMAAEFNRYNRRPRIVIEGAAQTRQFNGVFDADDPESLLLFLGDTPDLVIDRRSDEVVIRAR